jgi:large subunit ribosomal protein L22
MTPNTPGDPQKGKPAEDEQTELEAAEAKQAAAEESAAQPPAPEPGSEPAAEDRPVPQAEGTAADVTGVGKDVAAAALQEGSSEPLAAGADDDPAEAEEPAEAEVPATAEEPVADASAAGEPAAEEAEDEEADAAEAEVESDLAKTDEAEAEVVAETETAAPATGRRRGRRGRRGRGAGEEPAAPEAAPARRAPARREGELVLVRAQAKYVRTSARKARLVCDHIRGKSVDEARAVLAHTPRAVARDWSKLLESAIANAEHNHELIGEDLRVFAVSADEGPTLKRFRPRAMGRATRIRKRTTHLTITLTPKE